MNDLKSWNVQFAVNMQRVWNRKKAELARSHEQKIYRKLLVTLRMKSTYKLQVLIVHLKCLQQIFIFIKAVTQIVLGNGIELLHHLISQQEQHPTSKTKREIFKNYFFFFHKIENWWENWIFSIRHQWLDQPRWRCWSGKQWNQGFHFVKTATIEIRKSLLYANFENNFCDAHQLKQPWKETKIPDFLVSFFCSFA